MPTIDSDEKATCRHCRRVLIGKDYSLGGCAYLPDARGMPGRRAPVNFYGGYVCSRDCDYRAALALEQSMPGHMGQTRLSTGEVLRSIESNWRDE